MMLTYIKEIVIISIVLVLASLLSHYIWEEIYDFIDRIELKELQNQNKQ